MRHSLAVALSIGVVIATLSASGATLISTDGVAVAASLPTHVVTGGPAPHSTASAPAGDAPGQGQAPGSNGPAGGDPDTTVTFAVTTGALTLTAPASATLGSGAPGTTISGQLGTVTVTDSRALLVASWTTTASSTDFTTGGGTPAETIPAADATYTPGTVTTTGTITTSTSVITLSGTPQTVVTGSAGVGNNTASWNPTIAVAVPSAAVGGTYTGTLSESVS
jgi:hypothetical protein